jgi:signal transduction histidine kinase
MAERAEGLGGSFQTLARPGGGTLLVWRAPLRDDA